MNESEQLVEALSIAIKVHKFQLDKTGKPYILHPLHPMHQLLFDTQLATIAVLHDVIEDSNLRITDLEIAGFSDRVRIALELLTHGSIPYGVYIERICSNYNAIRVKRKDLEHNSNITRLKVSPIKI